jgi:DNA repair exonuclease SbcCD ATPase subunit
MILFKKLRWQNLLSTGNQMTEIRLDRSKSTLIVGENGAGKSTILDALVFALYGKPFRNINKPQLMNSITNKGLLVECEFSIGKNDFLVRRGMKPHLFEIYQNNVLINQSSSVKDYQDLFEKQILKLSFKSFGQIVVLGSANYLPFMQLPAHARREVIEDLLDIQIFSTMNTLLKEKIVENRTDINDIDHKITIIENKIELAEKHIISLRTNNEDLIKAKQDMINELLDRVASTEVLIEEASNQITTLNESIQDSSTVSRRKAKLVQMESDLETKIKKFKKEIDFFHDHDNCPTCRQGIDHNFKEEWITNRTTKTSEIHDAMAAIEKQMEIIETRLNEIAIINSQITICNTQITGYNADIRSWQNSIKTLNAEIESIRNNNRAIDSGNDDIDQFKKDLKKSAVRKEELAHHRQVLEVAGVLLKDTGIKTKIIKQYVPVMNKLINKYLAAMDFFVQFELDENFNETIKSRYRDDFSYASFSEGEKMRIDLSLMFTWRAIAKLRNSASTNLLIMDEVFDSSLDVGGTEEFMKILEGLTQDTNTFVISHKGDQLYDKFHSVIKFEKHANFSRMAA